MRDLDRGILGRGSHGLQQYEMLRRGTDALVNGILRVRRLLKQKRTADGDGMHLPCQDISTLRKSFGFGHLAFQFSVCPGFHRREEVPWFFLIMSNCADEQCCL